MRDNGSGEWFVNPPMATPNWPADIQPISHSCGSDGRKSSNEKIPCWW